MKGLEKHLGVIEEQNKELEKELENFIHCDETIKEHLRSRSPPKVRSNFVENGTVGKGGHKSALGFSARGMPGFSTFKESQSTQFGTSIKEGSPEVNRYMNSNGFSSVRCFINTYRILNLTLTL